MRNDNFKTMILGKFNNLTIQQINDLDEPDSIEFGSASKGGAIKVYGNFNRPDDFAKKIEKAIYLRDTLVKQAGE